MKRCTQVYMRFSNEQLHVRSSREKDPMNLMSSSKTLCTTQPRPDAAALPEIADVDSQ